MRQSQIRKTQMQKETQLFNCKTTLEYTSAWRVELTQAPRSCA
ncbi:hypothetical protein HMPREF1583_00994 [Gardnerella vaginalis JCP8151B]|nr:hypothetical protein HMPREF1583_00994 [Gardnerella vaginalis JCP8151B]